jgi:hypothetical protein
MHADACRISSPRLTPHGSLLQSYSQVCQAAEAQEDAAGKRRDRVYVEIPSKHDVRNATCADGCTFVMLFFSQASHAAEPRKGAAFDERDAVGMEIP